ncbi:MAG: hypothetical protein Kow00121_49850 [Elainellaceae cyanobacterium]
MTITHPTSGQLERSLSQRVQALYRDQLGHQPSRVSCQLFGEELAIIIEGSITQPEQILAQGGQDSLAKEVRSELDDALQPQLKALIREVLGVNVIDLLSDAALESGRTGIIVILSETPTVRNPGSIPKAKTKAAPASDQPLSSQPRTMTDESVDRAS